MLKRILGTCVAMSRMLLSDEYLCHNVACAAFLWMYVVDQLLLLEVLFPVENGCGGRLSCYL